MIDEAGPACGWAVPHQTSSRGLDYYPALSANGFRCNASLYPPFFLLDSCVHLACPKASIFLPFTPSLLLGLAVAIPAPLDQQGSPWPFEWIVSGPRSSIRPPSSSSTCCGDVQSPRTSRLTRWGPRQVDNRNNRLIHSVVPVFKGRQVLS